MPNHIALILVEGETDEVFYRYLGEKKLAGIPKRIRNMKGNFNINNKIIDKCLQFSNQHPDKTFDVYVCVDRERIGLPAYDHTIVDDRLADIRGFESKFDVIATLMIESLFFIDIANIYKHLRAPRNQRHPERYKKFRRLTHKDLSNLFSLHKKQYYKGHKCESLIQDLDLDLILGNAHELQQLVKNVRSRNTKFNS